MLRDLALGFVRVTEAAALAAARFLGRGDKNAADQAAVNGMRAAFDTLDVDGIVVIGEGELDEAPMLYIGEELGTKIEGAPKIDIAVDPLDGTNLIAKGLPNAISVFAAAERGCLLHAPDMYMKKIAVGPKARGTIDINDTVENNLRRIAKALDKELNELTVIMLDRERHHGLMKEVRELGARIKLIGDGDVAAAIATGFEYTGVDVLMGIGGAPEGVIAAAALKCLGGDFQGVLMPQNEEEAERCRKMGITDINKVFTLEDLVKGDEVFFAATGVSNGDLLKGVVYYGNDRAYTHSVVMRSKTGTVRFIEAVHNLNKKPEYVRRNI